MKIISQRIFLEINECLLRESLMVQDHLKNRIEKVFDFNLALFFFTHTGRLRKVFVQKDLLNTSL